MIPVHIFIHAFLISATAKAEGCSVRRIACTHCGTRYIYQLRRKVTASASGARWTGKAAIQAAAHAKAQKKLATLLATQHDPVGCPECGTLQPAMIRAQRLRFLNTLGTAGLICGIVLAAGWVIALDPLLGPDLRPILEIVTTAALVVFTLAALLMFRDPNRHAHRRTRAILGTQCRAMPEAEFDQLLEQGLPD